MRKIGSSPLLKRAPKFKHFFYSRAFENDTLKKISTIKPFGEDIVSAFKNAKDNDFSSEFNSTFQDLESYRKQLLKSEEEVDFGIFEPGHIKRVKDISRKASSPEIWCKFFFFLSYYSKSSNIMEIGTNLGVSGQYYLKALTLRKSAEGSINFTTLEGVEDLCTISENRFKNIAPQNCFKVINGLYEETLPLIYNSKQKYDVVFIDGNHRFKPTIEYYKNLYGNLSDKSIVIFDDINWSEEMQGAWAYLKTTQYAFSIDFYKLGILVIDKTNSTDKSVDFKLFLNF